MPNVTRFLCVGLIASCLTIAAQNDANAQYPVVVQPAVPAVVGYTAQRRGLFGRRVVYRPIVAPVAVAVARPVMASPPVVVGYPPVAAPVRTYYAPPVTAYYAPPVTTYYAPPVTTYRFPVRAYRLPVRSYRFPVYGF